MDHLLIVEDDADISGLLVKILKGAGYETSQAFSGTEARLILEKAQPDLILLDLMLPVLSAKNSLNDKVSLLKNGADDYITKPFEPEEVLARVEAALRRFGKGGHKAGARLLTYGQLCLDPEAHRVTAGGRELSLTNHEYDILYLLMEHPQKVFSRESLYELVWHGGYYGENNTVNVHVSNLRKKIKACGIGEEYIQTVYGIGFKLG